MSNRRRAATRKAIQGDARPPPEICAIMRLRNIANSNNKHGVPHATWHAWSVGGRCVAESLKPTWHAVFCQHRIHGGQLSAGRRER